MRILLLAAMQHVLQACEGRMRCVVFRPMQPALVLPCRVWLCHGSPGEAWLMEPVLALRGVLEGLGSWGAGA